MSQPRTILVVGGSLAGLRAAETLRREGFDGRLTILGAESHHPYDRPPLSKDLLLGNMDSTDVGFPLSDELGADWLLGDPATGLDLVRRAVGTRSGAEHRFDGLVIATGSVPRRLPPFDHGRPEVLELRTLDDALRLRATLASRPRVAVIGCGFIGVEVAYAARDAGAEVSIVSLDPPLVVAGGVVAGVCEELLLETGVDLHIGRHVVEVREGGGTHGLVLDDGTMVEADVILVAIGARPQTDWLEGSGLTLNDGVLCDACCAVLGPERVVAAGDVARWPNPLFGGIPMRIEHWTNAVEQGMAAARTLLHGSSQDTVYAPVPSFWSDHFGTRLQSVGLPLLGDRTEVVDGSLEERRFVLASYRGEELVGATTYGMVRGLVPFRARLARREPAAVGHPG
jgi:3-phenylpropionate/trans-cinnamate dioxygenase ferredoxin reductase component